MSLHIAASDISQGQNWCYVFKNVQYRLCHGILLHSIYHKDQTGVVYSKRQYRPVSLHIAAFAISQGHSWYCVFKMVQYNDDASNNNKNNNNEVNMARMSA